MGVLGLCLCHVKMMVCDKFFFNDLAFVCSEDAA